MDPNTIVRELTISQQQMIEIAKAISTNAKIIVMDEPTSSLTDREIEFLFDQIRKLREKNVSIIYISHKMDELSQIADSITIMRDGYHILTKAFNEITYDEIVQNMVGHKIEDYYPTYEPKIGKEMLRVENLSTDKVNCFDPSGLPNGIYNVDKEEYVYWWTGILFPFQYSSDRDELENYLGNQVVSSLMSIADELRKVEGNYCRSMIDSMHYLLKCYAHEKERGVEHPNWMVAIEKFCDKFIEIQNPNGSWNRGYSMKGEPLTNPPQWFGATEIEQGSGAIFPVELMVEMYKYTMDKKYLRSAEKAARFVRDSYVDDVEYIGGLNDTTHRKSVKIDAVGVMFAMRTMLLVYEANGDKTMLEGAYSAAKILASWVYLWDIPFDKTTLLGKHGFNTTGWANCDVIPAGSYVDCEFVEFIPEYLRIAEYCQDKELAIVARIVTRGMQHGLSMPQNMYGYAMPGVQCEGYMTSLWLADTEYKGFSGAAAKNKGDDNDTSNGLVNGQALLNLDSLERTYGTLDFDEIFRLVIKN